MGDDWCTYQSSSISLCLGIPPWKHSEIHSQNCHTCYKHLSIAQRKTHVSRTESKMCDQNCKLKNTENTPFLKGRHIPWQSGKMTSMPSGMTWLVLLEMAWLWEIVVVTWEQYLTSMLGQRTHRTGIQQLNQKCRMKFRSKLRQDKRCTIVHIIQL